ncbi:MAG: biotin/lipoyl-binding protein [FCB group bacterium]|nr:biotin/lipoyl-binding protein [FCB group bacterium]
MKYLTTIGSAKLEFEVTPDTKPIGVKLLEQAVNMDCRQLSPNSFSLLIDGKSYFLTITENGGGFAVTVNQKTVDVFVQDETGILLDKFGMSDSSSDTLGKIIVPIPGLIAKLFVSPGDTIEKDQKLFILEAMKMENEFTSPVSGTLSSIHVKKGDTVNKGTLIMEITI